MVEFLTKTGILLDLSGDFDFEITIENPLFSDDRVPVPFSTTIAFLPTAKNKRVFGYLNALMLAPSVKSLEIDILINGFPFFSGTLEYDGVDTSGNLNYTFAGRGLADAWTKEKIWQISEIAEANIHEPLVVNELLAAEPGFRVIGDYQPTEVNVNYKYRNFPTFASSRATLPAVSLSAFFQDDIVCDPGRLDEHLPSLVIFGTYAGETVAETLPDISRIDLMINVCRMFCAALFQDGSRYRIVSAESILSASSDLDWDSKISDIYSLSWEPRQNYELSFNNSEDYDTQGEFTDVDSLSAVLGHAGIDEYLPVHHTEIDDYYSLKTLEIPLILPYTPPNSGTVYRQVGKYTEYLIDRLNSVPKTQQVSDPAAEMHSVDVAFIPAKAAPVGWDEVFDDSPASSTYVRRMASFVKLPSPDVGRPTDVYIAIYGNNQVCDKAVVFSETDSELVVSDMLLDEALSLEPKKLFDRFHRGYASWLAGERQIILADINLSAKEISSFRMWQKVAVRGRHFLVRKLMIRISSASGGIISSCELISV